MNDVVPRNTLVKYGMKAAGGIGGGIVLFILRAIAVGGKGAFSLPGLIVGGIFALVGLGLSTSKDDRSLGLIAVGAGALTAIASLPIVGWLGGALMWISGIGLLIGGGLNLFRFIRGKRTRM